MNIKAVYLIFTLFVLGCSASSQNEVSNAQDGINLTGTVSYPQQGLIIFEQILGNQAVPVDTIKLDEQTNAYNHVVDVSPGYYRLNFYNQQIITLILDKDDVEVNVDGNNARGFVEIKGSRDHDLINEIQTIFASLKNSAEFARLNNEFADAQKAGNKERIGELQLQYLNMEAENHKKVVSRLREAGASLAAMNIAQTSGIDKDKHFDYFLELSDLLKNEMPDSPIAQEFISQVEQMKKLAIGKVAPDISLPNPDGELVSLSSLRGKYVLVDFWAKWCKPCRLENPNVVRLFNKYNDKGFEVFGVSLDRNRNDWLKAIEEDKLHWTQVSDLKFWNSEAAQIYNVKAIPFALLLDPDGVIIGKNLRGKALEKKLEEIFKEI